MARKHHLTRKTDHFDGIGGKDLFLAPAFQGSKATLSSKDVLDGRGGIDTIKAFIAADSLTPRLKRIENAVLTRDDTDALSLDLARATGMRSMTLTDFDSNAAISNAGRLSSLTLLNPLGNDYSVSGIDTAKVGSFQLKAVNAGQAAGANVHLDTKNGAGLANLDVSLADSAVILHGVAGPKNLTIHSGGTGNFQNEFDFDAGVNLNGLQKVTVDGGQELDLDLVGGAGPLAVDAVSMTGALWLHAKGPGITSIATGSGNDSVLLEAVGSQNIAVSLGEGTDTLEAVGLSLDPALHHFDGGAGFDLASISGELQNVGSVLSGFEYLNIGSGKGSYDLSGTDIALVSFRDALQSAVVLDQLSSDAMVMLWGGFTQSVTTHVKDAAGLTTDSLELQLYSGEFGSIFQGFRAPNLSKLEINSFSGTNKLHLSAVGAVGDAAIVTIDGGQKLDLNATLVAKNYIKELTITNSAGVDILGLTVKSFVDGAVISGGAGNDVLIGGTGSETISSGGGDNIIYGTLGNDTINLLANSGQDVLIFSDVAHSTISSPDTVYNFGLLDQIDLTGISSKITFASGVTGYNDGLFELKQGEIVAFFDPVWSNLYADINTDGAIDMVNDLMIHLEGVTDLYQWNLVL